MSLFEFSNYVNSKFNKLDIRITDYIYDDNSKLFSYYINIKLPYTINLNIIIDYDKNDNFDDLDINFFIDRIKNVVFMHL